MSEFKKAFNGESLFTLIKAIMELNLPETQDKNLNSILHK
jgi:hypothetical protein